ncbi:MAG: cobalamin-dependent protein [Candidatus Omnitrophota bacterium]
MRRKRILLVYPMLGMAGSLTRHIPLSLLYASIGAIKAGFEVDIVDARISPRQWKEQLISKITPDTIIIGLSVMTGAPIKNALNISRWVKSMYPDIKVVWGGPHATFNSHDILVELSVDYVVSGYGSKPLAQLAMYLRGDETVSGLAVISGLVYRDNGKILLVPPENEFELIDYKDIPYYLIESDFDRYGQLDNGDRIFPMYSVMGCPYKCAFCSSPAQYKNFKKKIRISFTSRGC